MTRAVISLSFIASSRFLGLIIVFPVISLYSLELKSANEFLVGVLLGVYAISQMLLQVPFGTMSDKFGRKHTMTFGLVLFIIGSVICANASDIYTMIVGRFIQGSGAIGAVATAMISDFTPEESMSKNMAIMGGMIGVTFCISMIASPILAAKFGLSMLFYISAVLSAFCIVMIYTIVPKEIKIHSKETKVSFVKLILKKDLFIINITNLMQKVLASATFTLIPVVLIKTFGYEAENLWKVYTISTIIGFIAMGLAGALGEKHSKKLLIMGVVFFIASYFVFGVSQSALIFNIGVAVFFIGFNIHEPIMQSCAAKFALSSQKGVVLGIFNSFGYAGSFIGGIMAGYALHKFSITHLSVLYVVLSIFWLFMLFILTNPSIFKNIYLKNGVNLDKLDGISGIIERYRTKDGAAIKYNSSIITKDKIDCILNS